METLVEYDVDGKIEINDHFNCSDMFRNVFKSRGEKKFDNIVIQV